ncbi:MoxR-like ATPase [Lentzea sp. NBRC 105346]|uniref:AAA family ATPase n=1 Tax=Lentzea sp. NBRC 105346 TaxID=3032205 RepID=UPI0024A0F5AB|nr:MoxR family ATPase [Lentzea sp. NBRC 105346]GLZ28952.1 MoxR-like ATPase [Lentzea sp. NBRC 105346]
MSTAIGDGEVLAFRDLHTRLGDAVETAVRGKRDVIDLVLVAMFAGGHVLLEDVPGTGKTTLARAVAGALGGVSRRVQFTPDLLPSDVTGTSVYDPQTGQIRFRPGPVFANIVLADEINRAAAKTQSAMLEVMEERTVTVDGVGHAVPDPFLVVATQNPIDLDGTYRLPEAQLDRFMLRTSIGYPSVDDELDVLRPGSGAGRISGVRTVSSPREISEFSRRLSLLHVADPILRYISDLGAATRSDGRLRLGASTRGLRVLVRAVQVYAASRGRHFAVPGDVQDLASPVLAHRLVLTRESVLSGTTTDEVLSDVLATVPVPKPA